MRKLFILIPLFILSGCMMSEWVKPGASMEEFSYTKYQCLQESQQREARSSFGGAAGSRYGGAYGGNRSQYGGLYGGESGLAFGGDSVDHVVTNDGLFRACMNAHGWYLQQVGDYRQGYN